MEMSRELLDLEKNAFERRGVTYGSAGLDDPSSSGAVSNAAARDCSSDSSPNGS